ncbi:ABC transporter substrate-binding protein [Melaminivora alkalimesophila]|uniref:Amino acid/amide ABC transporter substrate-binding protein (HAAT family) n=1 Tax=Melaminivora alkalimesophila TaxID=1165852 RepID=A0A317R8D0_9BURK|nr:ABC transporter substrate-binding protein [Melaminivora alkalimesophila]PWW44354.1 amino acid/amide ABC transporter substrate-binding protein (HAAT family) [Melaminivora alkalimesophila]
MTQAHPFLKRLAAIATAALFGTLAHAQAQPPIKIGINAPIQVQVGRDIRDGAQLAVDEINAKGGVLGRQLSMVVADETEDPEKGISAIKKLTADEKVDVLIGGYTSGVTLAQLPHITRAKTIALTVGAASPAITAKVKQNYDTNKYIFRTGVLNSLHLANGLLGYMTGFLHGELGLKKFAIVGESAKWVQDLLPYLKKSAQDKGLEIVMAETFDTGTTNFSPLLSKVKNSGAEYMVVILSHASSDILAKQWYDARVPVPYGGIDVKSQDTDFFERVGGKSLSEVAINFIVRAPLSERTLPFFEAFEGRYKREPVYTGAGAYDSVYAYADAVTRAGKLDTDAVIKALETIDMPVTTGRMQLDESHDLKAGAGLVNLLFVQWQEGGKRVIVWPKEARTGDYVKPQWMN